MIADFVPYVVIIGTASQVILLPLLRYLHQQNREKLEDMNANLRSINARIESHIQWHMDQHWSRNG